MFLLSEWIRTKTDDCFPAASHSIWLFFHQFSFLLNMKIFFSSQKSKKKKGKFTKLQLFFHQQTVTENWSDKMINLLKFGSWVNFRAPKSVNFRLNWTFFRQHTHFVCIWFVIFEKRMKEEKLSNTGSIPHTHVKLFFFVSFSIYHHSADEIFLNFNFETQIHVVNFPPVSYKTIKNFYTRWKERKKIRQAEKHFRN